MDKLYIPGDLVYFGGEKAKVWFRNPSADDSVYVRVIENGGENRIWNASLKEEISPIPLTPEILEKNGWKKFKRPYSSDYCYRRKGYPTLNIRSEKEVYFHWGDHDESITTVHQLQHLLFGLGLNSEMEV